MGVIKTNIKAKQITCALKVIRADGTKEDLGVQAYYNSNPFKMWFWQIRHWLESKVGK